MKSSYKKLASYISEIDIRNRDGKINNLIGVSITKEFIPSVANVIGTDLNNYKVISRGVFACSLMQVSRDGGIAISLYENNYPSIMSPAYHLFKVNDSSLLPEYLFLVFKSVEFDRAAVFYAVGGVRGTLTWDEFVNMRIPVPPIEEQKRLINNYEVVKKRIRILSNINDNLYSQLFNLYKVKIENNDKLDKEEVALNEIYDFQYGKGNNIPSDNGEYPVYGSNGIVSKYSEYNNENSCVIGHVGVPGSLFFAFGKHFVTYNGIICYPKKEIYRYYGYCVLTSKNLRHELRGTSQQFLSYDILNGIKILIPNDKIVEQFNDNIKPIFNMIYKNIVEIDKLLILSKVLISNIKE